MRPRKHRIVGYSPEINYFKPKGVQLSILSEVHLTVDEREALRLADLMGMSHEDAGQRMGVSRATFGRIVQRARNAVADALINGKAIRIDGGVYELTGDGRQMECVGCHHKWEESISVKQLVKCPSCEGDHIHRIERKI